MMSSGAVPSIVLWLLPASFLLHEAEEAVRLPGWLAGHRGAVVRRFPRLARVLPREGVLTRRRFAWMAAEECVLLTAATAYAAFTGRDVPWLMCFAAFEIHLVAHLAQGFMLGRALPVGFSSVAGLLYGVWALHAMRGVFDPVTWLWCAAAGCAIAAVNLWLLHRLAGLAARRAAAR